MLHRILLSMDKVSVKAFSDFINWIFWAIGDFCQMFQAASQKMIEQSSRGLNQWSNIIFMIFTQGAIDLDISVTNWMCISFLTWNDVLQGQGYNTQGPCGTFTDKVSDLRA